MLTGGKRESRAMWPAMSASTVLTTSHMPMNATGNHHGNGSCAPAVAVSERPNGMRA